MRAHSERQRKAAIRELIHRKCLDIPQQDRREKTKRPFGSATLEQVKRFADHKDNGDN